MAPVSEMTTDSRRRLGAFATPRALARRVVELAFEDSKRLPRTLDPALGDGVFVTELLGVARERGLTIGSDVSDLLAGFEIDPAAFTRAVGAVSRCLKADETSLGGFRYGDFLATEPAPVFDLVIGNPPWVSFSGKHRQISDATDRRTGWDSLHGRFVVRAIEWTAPNGKIAFILPASLMHQRGYGPIRAALRHAGTVEQIEPLPDGSFFQVIGPSVLFIWRKGKPDISADPAAPFFIEPARDVQVSMLISRIFAATGRANFHDCGIHTGNAAKLLLSSSPRWNDARIPIREGRDIAAYCAQSPRVWACASPQLPPGQYASVKSVPKQLEMPILLRQTASRPVAAQNLPAYAFRNSVLGCSGMPDHDHGYVVAVLNSSLTALALRHISADVRQRVFPQVKVNDLRELPLQVLVRSDSRENPSALAVGLKLADQWIRAVLESS